MSDATEPRTEDRRVSPDARRGNDRYEHGKFIIAIAAFTLTLVTGVWAIARSAAKTQTAIETVASIDQRLASIDGKLNGLAITDNSRAKDIEFLKRENDRLQGEMMALRADWKETKDLQDTWIKTTRELVIEMRAEVKNRK